MDIELIQYIEIDTIGIVLLMTMLFYIVNVHRDTVRSDQRHFVKMLLCNIFILVADMAIYMMEGNTDLIFLNHLMCMLFFGLHVFFGYNWLRYSCEILFPKHKTQKKVKMWLRVPCYINLMLVISSPWTNWIYRLTDQNVYVRGKFMWVAMGLTCGYWIVSALLVLKEMMHPKMAREKSVYFTLLFFPLPTMIGNAIQLLYYGISVVWICSAISLLISFINLQSNNVTRDILTGLFNRRQTSKELMWEVEHLPNASDYLFVMMIDVDLFKNINDTFGHLVGDQALIECAKILKNESRNSDFVGRFGGDEFVILGHVQSENGVKEMIANIQKALDDFNTNSSTYSLSLSIGYKLYNRNDQVNMNTILFEADKKMYEVKSQKKVTL